MACFSDFKSNDPIRASIPRQISSIEAEMKSPDRKRKWKYDTSDSDKSTKCLSNTTCRGQCSSDPCNLVAGTREDVHHLTIIWSEREEILSDQLKMVELRMAEFEMMIQLVMSLSGADTNAIMLWAAGQLDGHFNISAAIWDWVPAHESIPGQHRCQTPALSLDGTVKSLWDDARNAFRRTLDWHKAGPVSDGPDLVAFIVNELVKLVADEGEGLVDHILELNDQFKALSKTYTSLANVEQESFRAIKKRITFSEYLSKKADHNSQTCRVKTSEYLERTKKIVELLPAISTITHAVVTAVHMALRFKKDEAQSMGDQDYCIKIVKSQLRIIHDTSKMRYMDRRLHQHFGNRDLENGSYSDQMDITSDED